MVSRSYLFLVVVLALAGISGYLYWLKGQPRWGLDIRGGVQLVYQMTDLNGNPISTKPTQNANGTTGASLAQDAQERTAIILGKRASKDLGVVDADVETKGNDQFIVRLPAFSDVTTAEKTMGSSAQLQIYDATNVNTDQDSYKGYSINRQENSTEVSFTRTADGKLIKPGTPEYAEMIKGWGPPIAKGDDLVKATMEPVGASGEYQPLMNFGPAAAKRWQDWSYINNHRGENIAAVLDGTVISIAPIKDGAVLGDSMVTEGHFSTDYVRNLVDLLNSGALPVNLKILSASKVDSTIGQNALNMIFTAGVIASAVIILFMLIYYVFPGLIAVIALGLYILFTLTALKLIDATFSLPAIAGFVLSVGMAVDANILVFERLKEEMRSGKDLHRALTLAFKRALPAIIDSNACTTITALVLLYFGTGPVKGFATTLVMGVAISFFTAVVITRSLLEFAIGSGVGNHPKWYGLTRQWFGESLEAGAHKKPLQVVNRSGKFFLISAIPIIPGIIFFCMGGLKGNVEFTGGTQATYKLEGANQNMSAPQIVANLDKAGLPGCSVILGNENDAAKTRLAYITVPPNKLFNEESRDAASIIAQKAGLDPKSNTELTAVGGTVQRETITNAILGVLWSTGLIIFYLGIRFGAMGGFRVGLRFSATTVLSLLHDMLVVVGLAAAMGYLLNWQVSALFISAILTVVGFSTHDTIVIFDRIRENLKRASPGEEIGDLINRSITQSIARSINTAMTVIVTLFLLILVGSATPELKLFNLAMLTGIVSGTYSSIFSASPILYLWDRAIGKKHPEKTLLGIAAQERVVVKRGLTQEVPTYQKQEPQATPGYGQVKRRRASDVERSKRVVDDDL